MRQAFKKFLSGPFGRQITALMAYYLLIWPIQLSLVSVATYFHLGMEHPLGVIEQWLFAHGPWIMMASKLSAAGTVLMFVFQAGPHRHPYRKVVMDRLRPPDQEIILVTCVAAVLTLATGMPERASVVTIAWGQVGVSLLGTCIFYGTDLYVLFALAQEFPLSLRRRMFVQALAVLMMWGFGKACFPFADGMSSAVLFNFLTLLFLAHWHVEDLVRPGLYLGLFLAPFAALMGLDPMWGTSMAPFVAAHRLGPAHSAILLSLAIGHAYAKERNLFRHKYLAGP